MELALPSELIERLKSEAARLGEPPDRVAERLLDERLPKVVSFEAGQLLIARWIKEAESMTEEEFESNAAVLRAIDSHRPHRPLFTEILADAKRLVASLFSMPGRSESFALLRRS